MAFSLLAEYMMRSGARYFSVISSVQTLELDQIVNIYRFLKQEGVVSTEFDIKPIGNYHLVNVEGLLSEQGESKEPVDPNLVALFSLVISKLGPNFSEHQLEKVRLC